jgi:hypothetical protein
MNRIPNMILPPELRGEDFGLRGRQISMDSEEDEYQIPRKKKDTGSGGNSCTSCEGHMNPLWKLPTGMDYHETFKGDNRHIWHLIKSPGDKRKRSVCLNFQARGVCQLRCPFSHAYCSEINPPTVKIMTDRFQKIYSVS